MKIAVWHNLPSGGGKRALYNHVKALLDNGFEVESWTSDMSSSDYLPLSDLIPEHRKSIKNYYLACWDTSNPIKREQHIFSVIKDHCIECINEIEEMNFDLLFANSCRITHMPFIGRFTSIKKLVYLGEPYRPLYEAYPENIWEAPYEELKLRKVHRIINDFKINYARRLKIHYELEAARSYDRILVNSLYSRESVMRAYGLDSSVCYLGIDVDKFNIQISHKENYVVSMGTISFIKSVDKAIRIIAEIPREIRPVLKWIANGVEKEYLDSQIELANKLNVRFEYHLNISDKDLIEIVSKAAVMLYVPRLEPFGLAPLEANACGTYVIAIAEGGVRESIKDGVNGLLVNGFNTKELSENIIPFISNLEYALEKGLMAKEYARNNWNLEQMSRNLLNAFDPI